MKKQTATKIILGSIIFTLFVSVSPVFSPLEAATNNNMSSLYSNPNQNNNNKNPYRFKITDVVNSNLLTNVVGCTGVVNKVSTWMVKFVQSPEKQAEAVAAQLKKTREQLAKACSTTEKAATTVAGIITQINNATDPVKISFDCKKVNETKSQEELDQLIKNTQAAQEQNFKEQCFDGIAITLAKNQLTAMTRSAVNWVNSGYGGNPFFVQSMTNLTNGIERNVLETGIDILLTPENQSPYARDFARSTVVGYGSRGIGASSSGFLSGLQSDLGAFITDPKSYYTNEQLGDAEVTRTALQRAQDANDAFANDFSVGGWNGWLALTQRDQNNPLGYTMLASQYLADSQAQKITQTNNELSQNNGFLNQKVCVKWQVYDENGKPKISDKYTTWQKNSLSSSFVGPMSLRPEMFEFTTTKPAKCYKAGGECCASEADGGWKVVTPGSIIRDKTTNYLNSPERQLELAKTINDSLNALFSILISKLESGGLAGLSDSAVSNSNWIDNMNSINTGYEAVDPYDNNDAYNNFNLTRDLGNKYYHDTPYRAGTWNAKTGVSIQKNAKNDNGEIINCESNKLEICKDKLISGYIPPVYDDTGKYLVTSNVYWEVTTPGNSEIIVNGYNGWEIGDRAYWDGSAWQNWKCKPNKIGGCSGQLNPIKERGVIQVQKDYIVAAKEILKVLPTIMTKLGELDYCLPGPNPNYKTNSTDAQSAYGDWVGSLYVGPTDEYRTSMSIDHQGDRTYDNLAKIYDENSNVWAKIRGLGTNGWPMDWLLQNFNFYHYDKNGNPPPNERESLNNHRLWMELNLNYVGNSLFQNFYEYFDKMMDKLYFKNMVNKYIEREDSYELKNNPGYIKMAESGLNLTKDILYYNDDVTKATQGYKDAITQAQLNINKLEPIKTEVSKIITDAQNRRNKAFLEKLKKETEIKCAAENESCMRGVGIPPEMMDNIGEICLGKRIACLKNVMTETEYKAKYAGCLEEENIQFFDVEDITSRNTTGEERCGNGFDDDLDGLVDSKDPDCAGSTGTGTGTTNYSCLPMNTHETDSYISDKDCSNGKCLGVLKPDKFTLLPCENRQQNNCEATEFINTVTPTSHFNWFDPYNEYKTTSCAWVNVIPTGSCYPVSESKTNAYYSDLSCKDGKCLGNLNRNGYTPIKCENRSPNDCAIKESIYAGPSYHQNWFDPYNEYTVKKCAWKPY